MHDITKNVIINNSLFHRAIYARFWLSRNSCTSYNQHFFPGGSPGRIQMDWSSIPYVESFQKLSGVKFGFL